MTTKVDFFLNGKRVSLDDPSPDLLLIDYLRSPEVGLAGPKKACGQGGCGACTVILSSWNAEKREPTHRAINSCLRPVCALGGLVVTTVEGTGAARTQNPEFLRHSLVSSRAAAPPELPPPPRLVQAQQKAAAKREQVQKSVQAALAEQPAAKPPKLLRVLQTAEHPTALSHHGINPVAHRLALNNGSQCGYCSVGFVMNMSEFLINHPRATKRQIEDIFDGNLCRCTGYRPILEGMKTFASDWSAQDAANQMHCLVDDGSASQLPGPIAIPFPPAAEAPPQPVTSQSGGQSWHTPTTLAALAGLLRKHRGERPRLVHGNTSFGVYPEEYWGSSVFIDVRLVPELHRPSALVERELRVAAGTSYGDFISFLEVENERDHRGGESNLAALLLMARRTAGRIVRNAASLGGNTMLVLKHIAAGSGKPFPSDLATALVAVGASVEYLELDHARDQEHCRPLSDLLHAVEKRPALADEIVLLGYRIPLGSDADVTFSQKVALRDVNAHSIVNATTRLTFSAHHQVRHAVLVFGGIAPLPFRATQTEQALIAGTLSLDMFPRLAALLEAEVRAELSRWAARMAPLPDEGFSDEYRVALALSFLYKAIVHALLKTDGKVPEEVASSGRNTWGEWPVSYGTQSWEPETFKRPVALPYIKVTAMYQCSGQLHYTQERAVPPLTANAAMVVSTRALAKYRFVLPNGDGAANPGISADALRRHLAEYASSFIDLVTCESIKDGGINLQGMGGDQPLFAEDVISFAGQNIALVLADNEQEAIRIARYVTDSCVAYVPVTWPAPWNDPKWSQPILGIEEALRMGSIFPDSPDSAVWNSHIWKITRPGSRFDWATADKDPLDAAIVSRESRVDGVACQVVESTQRNGGQAHFYMETQACIAEPADGRRMILHASTQSPMAMHQTTAMALGVEYHRVDVQIPPVGGGFGGKTEQARFVVGPTAVAAHVLKRPVRLAMRREEDTALIGKRHAYYGQYQIAIDRGEVRPEDRGLLRGMLTRMWGDGGAFYDCSFIVSNCMQLRADNAYRVANFENQIDVCRTNTSPSTAFRAFGDVQCKNIQENAIDDAAFSVGMTAEAVREKNLYQRGDVTPFGQALSYCYMSEVWAYLKQVANYEEKQRAVEEYNRTNRWRKRGLAMIPVKYGSGYNLVQLEQASAYITVNQGDGSVIVHQGGVEIGQGLVTQVQQVAAYVLNVPMSLIYVESVSTGIMPNATSTGGSTGTPYNAEVVKQTCEKLAARLAEFARQMRLEQGDDWCKQQLIDYWNYPDTGWQTKVPSNGPGSSEVLIWQKLVSLAYSKRVELNCAFTAKIQGGTVPVPCMTYKPRDAQPTLPGIKPGPLAPISGAVDSFVGFTYSAACSVVELDVLTGEVKILSADVVYDMGRSMNPAIDIGQVEGAFMQGVGYLLTEKLVFESKGDVKGRLNSVNTWDYKPPASTSVPLEFNVHLFPRGTVPSVPEDPHDVFSAKEVGEPPLVLANSVFFAVKAAVRASRLERGRDGLFRMDAPATVEEVRRACDVSINDFS